MLGDLLTPAAQVEALGPGESADRALQQLGRRGVDQLLVVDQVAVVGLVVRGDLLRWLALRGGASQGELGDPRHAHAS